MSSSTKPARAFDDRAALPDGVQLIEASAGTGKTHAITSIVVRLVAELGVPLREILVVTFTEAATSELRDRIRQRLLVARAAYRDHAPMGEVTPTDQGSSGSRDDLFTALAAEATSSQRQTAVERLDTALASFDEAVISTIHGFCFRTLQEHAFESGATFDAELLQDTEPLLQEIVDDYWSSCTHQAAPGLVRRLLERRIDPERLFSLGRLVCDAPDAPITSSLSPSHLDADDWTEAVNELKAEHATCGDEILRLLIAARDAKKFKKDYVAEDIEVRYATVADWLAGDEAGRNIGDLPEGFSFFAASTMAEHWSKRAKEGPPPHPFYKLADQLVTQLDSAADQVLVDWIESARVELRRRKDESYLLAYDDLLLRLRDALDGHHGEALAKSIGDRFNTALIDEFQDTDAVQYAIFRRAFLRSGRRLFLIGDPKQAIYSFRGADLHAYLKAADDARTEEGVSTLARNYRSDAPLVHALSALFQARPQPFLEPRINFTPPEEKHEVRWTNEAGSPLPAALRVRFATPDDVPTPDRQKADPRKGKGATVKGAFMNEQGPAIVSTDIVAMLGENIRIEGEPISPRHIAVLVRTNAQARAVQSELRVRQVPSVLHGDSSVFDSNESRELHGVLRAIAEPWNQRLLRAALATDLILGSGDELVQLHEAASAEMGAEGDASDAWDRYVETFRELKDLWYRRGFIQMFQRMLRIFNVASRRLAIVGGERTMTNLLHLGELLQRMSREERLGPSGLLRRLARLRSGADDHTAHEARQIRLESDREAVHLVTIHRSKGLQYPIVFLPFAWAGSALRSDSKRFVRYHDANDQSMRIHLYPAAASATEEVDSTPLDIAEQETFAEDIRLLYVALTRARHHVTVYHGAISQPTTPSARAPLSWLTHPAPAGEDPRASDDDHDKSVDGTALRREQEALLAAEPDELRENIARIARESGTSFEVLPMISPSDAAWIPPSLEAPELKARSFSRKVDRAWRVASFTQLTSNANELFHSEDRLDPSAEPEAMHARSKPADSGRLLDLPRGAATGNLLHTILENVDFAPECRQTLAPETERQLLASGIDERFKDSIVHGLGRVLDAPIHIPSPDGEVTTLRLTDIPASRRLVEMEFILPASQGDAEALRPDRLAAAFRRHGSSTVCGDYLDHVTSLRFEPLRGYLRGFIDLTFADDRGRFFVVDYKSNHLGDHLEDYAPAKLGPVMASHHYHLQYHLYCVALHRHLRARLPGYDPAIHLGGVLYLFLRGMDQDDVDPETGGNLGVFHDRPSVALIEALDAAISPGNTVPREVLQ